MFFQKASDPVEEATVAEVTAVVEVIVVAGVTEHRRDRPAAVIHPHDPTAVRRYAQVPAQAGKVQAAAMAAVRPAHHDRAHRGQAAQCGKDRAP
jgi:hypothetical protein